MELMSDPVMVATGHTYDRQCIAKWLAQGNRTCPVTGMRLRHLELVPNHALRNAIQVSNPGMQVLSNASGSVRSSFLVLMGLATSAGVGNITWHSAAQPL